MTDDDNGSSIATESPKKLTAQPPTGTETGSSPSIPQPSELTTQNPPMMKTIRSPLESGKPNHIQRIMKSARIRCRTCINGYVPEQLYDPNANPQQVTAVFTQCGKCGGKGFIIRNVYVFK